MNFLKSRIRGHAEIKRLREAIHFDIADAKATCGGDGMESFGIVNGLAE